MIHKCEDCGTKMDWKFTIYVSQYIETEIRQCPKCKRIDAFTENHE